MQKILVVGTNHAGTHAVQTLTQNYKDSVEVITYDKNDNISFLGCGMALWIGNVIDSPEGLFYANKEILEQEGAQVFLKHEFVDADFENKTAKFINLENNEEIVQTYDKIIFAMGSWPILPELPGHDLKNIKYAKLFSNAVDVIEILKDQSIKKIAVVGAGYIGVELAESFLQNGKEVVLINEGNVLNRYYDKEFQVQMNKNLENNGIKCCLGESVTGFEGVDGKVTKVLTTKASHDADLVLMSIGFRPLTDILKGKLDMLPNGAIITNDQQETSQKDVYAIGDCATVYNNASRSIEHIALATNAVRTGIVAGHNAAGTEIHMQGVQGSNAIHIFGMTMCSTGMTEECAILKGFEVDSILVDEWLKPEFMKENDKVQLKIVWDKESRRILGAQMLSTTDVTLALHVFSMAIQESYSIDRLALLDLFFLPHFNQPHNFITKAALLGMSK